MLPDNLPLLNALPLVGDQLGLLLPAGVHQVRDDLVIKALVGGFFGELPRLIRSAPSPTSRWPARWLTEKAANYLWRLIDIKGKSNKIADALRRLCTQVSLFSHYYENPTPRLLPLCK